MVDGFDCVTSKRRYGSRWRGGGAWVRARICQRKEEKKMMGEVMATRRRGKSGKEREGCAGGDLDQERRFWWEMVVLLSVEAASGVKVQVVVMGARAREEEGRWLCRTWLGLRLV